jgi:hypothetical protein
MITATFNKSCLITGHLNIILDFTEFTIIIETVGINSFLAYYVNTRTLLKYESIKQLTFIYNVARNTFNYHI